MEQGGTPISRRDFARTAALTAGALGASAATAAAGPAEVKVGLYSITYLGVWYRGGALTLE